MSRELFSAIEKCDLSMASRLLGLGFSANSIAPNGDAALVVATRTDESMVSLLLKHRADPNMSINEHTPLITAVDQNKPSILKLLLQAKSSPNQNNTRGVFPLFLATVSGSLSMVTTLLNAKANVNDFSLVDDHEELSLTALHMAAMLTRQKLVKLLCVSKANINLKNSRGLAAINYSVIRDDIDTVRLLFRYNALLDWNSFGARFMFSLALSKNGMLAVLDQHFKERLYASFTPLMHAIVNGDASNVSKILSNNIDVDKQDILGQTALQHAVLRDDIQTTYLLLGLGAGISYIKLDDASVDMMKLLTAYSNGSDIDDQISRLQENDRSLLRAHIDARDQCQLFCRQHGLDFYPENFYASMSIIDAHSMKLNPEVKGQIHCRHQLLIWEAPSKKSDLITPNVTGYFILWALKEYGKKYSQYCIAFHSQMIISYLGFKVIHAGRYRSVEYARPPYQSILNYIAVPRLCGMTFVSIAIIALVAFIMVSSQSQCTSNNVNSVSENAFKTLCYATDVNHTCDVKQCV